MTLVAGAFLPFTVIFGFLHVILGEGVVSENQEALEEAGKVSAKEKLLSERREDYLGGRIPQVELIICRYPLRPLCTFVLWLL